MFDIWVCIYFPAKTRNYFTLFIKFDELAQAHCSSCCNNQNFMWERIHSTYGFYFQWSLRCCWMKFAHMPITIIAAITLQWHRRQQQSCQFWRVVFFCDSIYNFTEIFVAEYRAIFITFYELYPDELKVSFCLSVCVCVLHIRYDPAFALRFLEAQSHHKSAQIR